jgi:hypothetical protein
MSDFKVGDNVIIGKAHSTDYPDFIGQVLEIVKADPDDVRCRIFTVRRPDGREVGIFEYRLEPARRVEGQQIDFADIRIGDEIRVDMISDDLVMSRQGVLATTGSSQSNHSLWSAIGRRIDYNDPSKETITLIKAAPERDPVRDLLREKPGGTIVEYHTSPQKPILARKTKAEPAEGGAKWVIYFPSGQHTVSEKAFAEYIREDFDNIRWLS